MRVGRTVIKARRRPWLLVLGLIVGTCVTPARAGAQEADAETLPPLGILFYTPSTRAALDDARRSGRRVHTQAGGRQAVETTLRVDGMVVPSNGRRTAWVNGRTVRSGEELSEGLQVTVDEPDRGLVRLKTPDKGLVKVKPGESIRALLDEPLRPPAVMRAPEPHGGAGAAGLKPDSLEARLERIPAEVSLRDLIALLLSSEQARTTPTEDESREGEEGEPGEE